MSDPYRIDVADGVMTFTITRDEKLNAVTGDMMRAMRSAVEEADERDDVRVLVYTAEGRYFTSGLDLSTSGKFAPDAGYRRVYRSWHELLDHLEAIEKPVVLGVQARCLGLGVELGASCDFRLAADTSTFELPEIANLAIIPGSGGVSRLPRIIGPHWTKWLVMANQRITADEARFMGYVHAVYPAAEFHERLHDFVVSLTKLPREALGLAKLGIDHAVTADRTASRDFDRVAQTYLLRLDEHRQKIEAFANRKTKG